MNGAPDWQDGECCFRCRTQFTLVARKHHCRNCGNIFCAKCSSQQIPLPKLNIEKNVRVCDTCYEKHVGKNDDPLTLALNSNDTEQTKPKLAKSNSKSSTTSASSSNNKSAASASAPSEQELKEEEEFQLALALSLSETPTKVSFPEIRTYEEPKNAVAKNPTPTISTNSSAGPVDHSSTSNGTGNQRVSAPQPELTATTSLDYPSYSQPQMAPQMAPIPSQPIDYHIPERDQEVFRYVGEVQSTLEVFTNRLESCKLRNRPVANDAAIQSLFIRLNSEVQPKLSGYIQTYDEERADYERLQDKLSQIADARAALDALREEHQEKMRELAAEAERLRQTQLATKLEAMRQKKSQMMQYQRELALQRIKEQEMQQQQQQQQPQYQPTTTQGYQVPPVAGHHDSYVDPSLANHVHQNWQQQQQQQSQHQPHLPEQHYSQVQATNYVPTQQHYPQPATHATHIPVQQQYAPAPVPAAQPPVTAPAQTSQQPPSIDRASIAHLERQFLPPPKPDEDTPLISFDD